MALGEGAWRARGTPQPHRERGLAIVVVCRERLQELGLHLAKRTTGLALALAIDAAEVARHVLTVIDRLHCCRGGFLLHSVHGRWPPRQQGDLPLRPSGAGHSLPRRARGPVAAHKLHCNRVQMRLAGAMTDATPRHTEVL